MQALHIFTIVLNDKSKGPKKIYGHLIQVPSVPGTLTLDICGSRSAAAASSREEEWNMKLIVKQDPQKV